MPYRILRANNDQQKVEGVLVFSKTCCSWLQYCFSNLKAQLIDKVKKCAECRLNDKSCMKREFHV